MFQEGETEKRVTLTILDDLLPEDNEELFVYLLPQTEGVRVAQPALDNGRMVSVCVSAASDRGGPGGTASTGQWQDEG